LDILLVGSGSSTQETSAFDKVIRITPISTWRLHDGKLQNLLTDKGTSPRHRAENIITDSGEATVSTAIHNLFLKLLTSDKQNLLKDLGANFYMFDEETMNCTRCFVSFEPNQCFKK
jgi:hypothetical protein